MPISDKKDRLSSSGMYVNRAGGIRSMWADAVGVSESLMAGLSLSFVIGYKWWQLSFLV